MPGFSPGEPGVFFDARKQKPSGVGGAKKFSRTTPAVSIRAAVLSSHTYCEVRRKPTVLTQAPSLKNSVLPRHIPGVPETHLHARSDTRQSIPPKKRSGKPRFYNTRATELLAGRYYLSRRHIKGSHRSHLSCYNKAGVEVGRRSPVPARQQTAPQETVHSAASTESSTLTSKATSGSPAE